MQAQILSALSHPVIAAVHRRDQLARAAGRLIQNEIRELGD